MPVVRSRDRGRFLFFVGVNTLMNVGLTIGQSVSEGMFLSDPHLGAAWLPPVFIFTSIATAVTTMAYASVVDKVRNDTYFQWLHVTAGAILLAVLYGVWRGWTVPVMIFYGFYYVVSGIFNTHYWNYAADYFDALEARRLFPYFPLGNSIGGCLGGIITSLLADRISPLALASGWVLMLAATWLLIALVSPRLKGFVLRETEEADDASLSNLWQGFLFLRRSAMGRWHVVYAALMITCMYFLQYVYSDIFAHAYPTEQSLTAFVGRFNAAANLLEITLELTFTPRLIAMAGVGAANMIYPLSSMLAFGLLGAWRGVPTAIFGRINRETFVNAISDSCRNLLYNAYPARFRGRVRAFQEGFVTNAGSVLAGLILMAFARLVTPLGTFTVVLNSGIALAAVFLGVAMVLRSQYRQTVLQGLREWHVDLDTETMALKRTSTDELVGMLETLRINRDRASATWMRDICQELLARGRDDAVLERAASASPLLQGIALETLARSKDPKVVPLLEQQLGHPDAAVRVRALTWLHYARPDADLSAYLSDPDARVAATAAAAMGAWDTLQAMMAKPETRTAAITVLPLEQPRGVDLLMPLLTNPEAPVVLAVAQRIDRASGTAQEQLARLVPELLQRCDRDPIAAALLRLAGRADQPGALPLLARHLASSSGLVRQAAVEALRQAAPRSLPDVVPYLRAESTETVEAAVSVIGTQDAPGMRETLRSLFRELLDRGHQVMLAQGVLQEAEIDTPALRVALTDYESRLIRRMLAVLGALENPKVMRNVTRSLQAQDRQERGAALEALENLQERALTQGLVSLLDDTPAPEKIPLAVRWLSLGGAPPSAQVLADLLVHDDRWVRTGAHLAAVRHGWGGGGDASEEALHAMEHVLFLKKVPLFEQMSLEQLEVISRIATEMKVFAGEIIMRENELGDTMYVVVRGRVSVIKNFRTSSQVVLAEMGATDYFGEMAVLDNAPRSATVLVEEDTELLCISGEKLHDIIQQKPELAFEIFRVLTRRLRDADEKLAALSREVATLKQLPPLPELTHTTLRIHRPEKEK
ncbi:MAG: cyclic nucleotide-binding domain-containing protein [Candidatus Xenobia bacterium]